MLGSYNLNTREGLRPNWNVGILEYWARSEALALFWDLTSGPQSLRIGEDTGLLG